MFSKTPKSIILFPNVHQIHADIYIDSCLVQDHTYTMREQYVDEADEASEVTYLYFESQPSDQVTGCSRSSTNENFKTDKHS